MAEGPTVANTGVPCVLPCAQGDATFLSFFAAGVKAHEPRTRSDKSSNFGRVTPCNEQGAGAYSSISSPKGTIPTPPSQLAACTLPLSSSCLYERRIDPAVQPCSDTYLCRSGDHLAAGQSSCTGTCPLSDPALCPTLCQLRRLAGRQRSAHCHYPSCRYPFRANCRIAHALQAGALLSGPSLSFRRCRSCSCGWCRYPSRCRPAACLVLDRTGSRHVRTLTPLAPQPVLVSGDEPGVGHAATYVVHGRASQCAPGPLMRDMPAWEMLKRCSTAPWSAPSHIGRIWQGAVLHPVSRPAAGWAAAAEP